MKHADDTSTADLIGGAPASVTRYQGGKNGAGVFQTIINVTPWHWRYFEPFAGSAAVFRNKLPARGGNVLIERDPHQAHRLRQLESSNVTVIAGDAFAELQRLKPGAQDFVYLDPPYHPSARRDLALYHYELTEDDHAQLLHSLLPALTAARAQWALSGYRCAAYDDAAGRYGWHRIDYQAQTRRGPVTESLWTNYDPARVDRLHDYRHLGADFRERERIARKVRRWVMKFEGLPHHERGAIMAALASIAVSGSAAAGSTAGSGERIRRGG